MALHRICTERPRIIELRECRAGKYNVLQVGKNLGRFLMWHDVSWQARLPPTWSTPGGSVSVATNFAFLHFRQNTGCWHESLVRVCIIVFTSNALMLTRLRYRGQFAIVLDVGQSKQGHLGIARLKGKGSTCKYMVLL